MPEELIGQERAGVSSHKGDCLEREMPEQKNVPASPGAVSLAIRSIPETCSWPLCSTAGDRESRHLQIILEVRLCYVIVPPLGSLLESVRFIHPPLGWLVPLWDRFVLPSGMMLWPFLESNSLYTSIISPYK